MFQREIKLVGTLDWGDLSMLISLDKNGLDEKIQ